MELQREQIAQEEEYGFPFHYVAQLGPKGFRHSFVDSWGINYASTIEFLLERMNVGEGVRVVDVGCGDGRFTRELAYRFPLSVIAGIDYSDRAISLARAMNPGVSNCSFLSLDITKGDAPCGFDVAVLMEVFEHLPIRQASSFMKAVHRLLRVGGELHLTVPHQNKALEYKHFQHFSVDSIRAYLEEGFEVLEVVPFERITWSRKVIETILVNRYFVLNHSRLLDLLYRFYRRNLFFCQDEHACQRLYVWARAKA